MGHSPVKLCSPSANSPREDGGFRHYVFMDTTVVASGEPGGRRVGLWDELRTKYADVGFTSAVGELRSVTTVGGEVTAATASFTIMPGNRWHVTDDHGEVHIQQGARCWIRGGRGRLEPVSGGSALSAAAKWRHVHPYRLLGDPGDCFFADPHNHHSPAADPVASTVAGRPAWEFLLDPPRGKVNPLQATLDEHTGACLRVYEHADGDAHLMEITHVEFNIAVDPRRFLPSEPVMEPDYAEKSHGQLQADRDRFAGYLRALDHAPELIDIVQHSADPSIAAAEVAELLEVSHLTARAILDQPLHRFTALYRQRFAEQLSRVREVLGS